ncbi:DEAD/DEAH box helicase, partial [Solicola sp. PLA-1-18]|uniref:DEAD/DEAH box helicase n=1 Tax=Solicola sp. PLA-1-18 TaxID=3380532 RepID=UPI003B80F72C
TVPTGSASGDTPDAQHRTTFADLLDDDRILRVLADVGYEVPTPVQAAAVPAILEGRDVVGLAQTGTGKTAAFALPVLSRLAAAPDPTDNLPRALVLTPTRELAIQVTEAITSYAANLPGIRVLPIYGGTGYGSQIAGLKRGAQVVVGTPGRIIDHLDKRTLDLSGIDHLVLDEADEMLSMGFADDVERILSGTPEFKQVALFSATMPSSVRRLASRYLHEPVELKVAERAVAAQDVRQRWLMVPQHRKLDALSRILETESGDAMIVFVRTKQATEEVAERLRARGFSAAALNGDLVQAQRERTVGQLKNGAVDVLVATDVAARGLDVQRITHVVNFDIPHDSESYVHRIGRTGRAGRSGEALLFVTPRERRLLSSLERATKQPLTEMSLPTVDDVNAQRVEKFTEAIGRRIGSEQTGFFRQLLQEYATEKDVDPLDLAAALAVIAHDDKEFLLSPETTPVLSGRDDRKDRKDRPDRRPQGRKATQGMSLYRLQVGKRHKVGPGSIVGALANEGGLHRSDFGSITILGDYSVVELPTDLPPGTLERLERTRISGRLIRIQPDDGPPTAAARRGGDGPPTGTKPNRKPRHK